MRLRTRLCCTVTTSGNVSLRAICDDEVDDDEVSKKPERPGDMKLKIAKHQKLKCHSAFKTTLRKLEAIGGVSQYFCQVCLQETFRA